MTPAAPDRLTLRRPDDWHVHLRDGPMLQACAVHTARQFARAIIMPNLVPPVTTPAMADAYRARILAALPPGHDFTPLMTCYLTDATDGAMLADGHARGIFTAAKLYPAHATTNAAHGVSEIARLDPVFAAMARIGMPLLVHGEVTDPAIDVFDREAAFGFHLDIPSGTAVRFEPGQSRKVQITTFVGREVAYGMNNMTNGTTRSDIIKRQTMQRLKAAGYCFEGERYPVRTPADRRFGAKKKSK